MLLSPPRPSEKRETGVLLCAGVPTVGCDFVSEDEENVPFVGSPILLCWLLSGCRLVWYIEMGGIPLAFGVIVVWGRCSI